MASGLRELKKSKTRNLIVDTMLDLIRNEGYEFATIEEICRQCEISIPTFYNYFVSKDAVLGQIYIRSSHQFVAQMEEQQEANTSAKEKLLRFVSLVASDMLEDAGLWRTLILYGDVRPSSDLMQHQVTQDVEESFVALFIQGQREETLRDDQSPEIQCLIVDAALYTLCQRWAMDDISDEQLEPAFHSVVSICLSGMEKENQS